MCTILYCLVSLTSAAHSDSIPHSFIPYCINILTAKPIVSKLKSLRLQRDDFETLKVIGRGAFGEVFTSKRSL